MYRIELSPGEETAFRTIEELAVAIRRGVVTTHSRIWHNTSSKWLPIEYHPHFKVASAIQLTNADLVAGPPVKPLELLTLGELVDPPMPAVPPPAPVRPAPVRPAPLRPAPAAAALEPVREKRSSSAHEPPPAPRKKRASKPRRGSGRALRVALVGTLLIGGAHLTYSAVSAAFSEDSTVLPLTHRRLIKAPSPIAEQGRPETTAATVLPSLPRPSSLRASDVMVRTSSAAATPPESAMAPQIQPAPSSVEIAAPTATIPESLTAKVADSTGKKAMKRVLRAIAAPSTQDRPTPKR